MSNNARNRAKQKAKKRAKKKRAAVSGDPLKLTKKGWRVLRAIALREELISDLSAGLLPAEPGEELRILQDAAERVAMPLRDVRNGYALLLAEMAD